MRRVVLISGTQGAGKTALARALKDHLAYIGYNVQVIKLADPLYAIHDAAYAALAAYGIINNGKTDGPLLQLLGTEWGRTRFGADVWVNIARERIRTALQDGSTVVIVDDVRFPNELNAWDPNESCKVRLNANVFVRKQRAEKWRDNLTHPSETSLDFHEDKFHLVFTTEPPRTPDITALEVIRWMKTTP
jgi:hypothetical protein